MPRFLYYLLSKWLALQSQALHLMPHQRLPKRLLTRCFQNSTMKKNYLFYYLSHTSHYPLDERSCLKSVGSQLLWHTQDTPREPGHYSAVVLQKHAGSYRSGTHKLARFQPLETKRDIVKTKKIPSRRQAIRTHHRVKSKP